MKTLSGGMATMVAGLARTLGWCMQITRKDGQIYRYVSGAADITLGGNLYTAAPGFSVSNITCTLGFSVDSLEMTVLAYTDLVKADFLSGRWNSARVDFNQYNWADASHGFIPWPSYRVANVRPILGGFVLELRDLRQLWQQDYTLTTGKQCQNRLGDSRCTKVLTSFTHAFTVTGVTSRSVFTCSGLTQAAGYFDNGVCRFGVGLHSGLDLLILSHATGGVITLAAPLVSDITVGQTGNVIAGCLKRLEDCRDKFNNIINMRAPGVHAKTLEELSGG